MSADVLVEPAPAQSRPTSRWRTWVVGVRYPRALIFAAVMAAIFVIQDNVFDRDTYILIVERIRRYDLNQFLLTFNGVEFGSMAVFYLLAWSGVAAMAALALLVAAYSYLAMVRIRRNDQAIAFAILAMLFYGLDNWTNQLRAALAVSIVLFIVIGASEKRRTAATRDIVSVALVTLFHIQSITLAIALAINNRKRALLGLALAAVLAAFSFTSLLDAIGGSALALGKAGTYAIMEANVTASPLMKFRIVAMSALAFFVITQGRQRNLFPPLVYANGLIALIFWSSPFFFGRLTSTFVFFEPFFVLTHYRGLRAPYLAFLIATSAVKLYAR